MSKTFFKPFSESYKGTSETWTKNEKKNKSNTSTVGYVPLVKRINSLLQAGENLESMREVYYGISGEDDDELFDADIVDVSQYDSKLELLADVKEVEKRLTSKKKKTRATKGERSPVGNSDAPKEAKEELSTGESEPVSERATADSSEVK